jgi:hypothetical protein
MILLSLRISEVIYRFIMVQNRKHSMKVATALPLMMKFTEYKNVLIKIVAF